MTKLHINIEGMHCGACATGIQMLVSQMDGVSNISVDYDKKSGDLEFDEAKVKKEDIFNGIAELGYTAKE
mgnify:FL=1